VSTKSSEPKPRASWSASGRADIFPSAEFATHDVHLVASKVPPRRGAQSGRSETMHPDGLTRSKILEDVDTSNI